MLRKRKAWKLLFLLQIQEPIPAYHLLDSLNWIHASQPNRLQRIRLTKPGERSIVKRIP
jgi:hypothetical protein